MLNCADVHLRCNGTACGHSVQAFLHSADKTALSSAILRSEITTLSFKASGTPIKGILLDRGMHATAVHAQALGSQVTTKQRTLHCIIHKYHPLRTEYTTWV